MSAAVEIPFESTNLKHEELVSNNFLIGLCIVLIIIAIYVTCRPCQRLHKTESMDIIQNELLPPRVNNNDVLIKYTPSLQDMVMETEIGLHHTYQVDGKQLKFAKAFDGLPASLRKNTDKTSYQSGYDTVRDGYSD